MSESDSVSNGADPQPLHAGKTRQEMEKAGPSVARFEVSQEPLLTGGGDEPPMGTYSPAPAYEHLGDLPPTYGSQSVYLVAYDPRQLFAYWDVEAGSAGNASYALRVCRGDGEVEAEVAIDPKEAGRYLSAGVPGGTYYVELGTTGRAGRWRPLGFSGRVTMPPGGLAGEVEPKFATLPFHLSFQRLLELIQEAMSQGEGLTAALARLQGGDKQGIDSLLGTLASLSQDQLHALERLLGQQIDLRTEAGGSFGGSSENSVLTAGVGGSESLSSGVFGSGGASSEAFGSETLASGAAGFGSETLASGAVGFGSGWLSSLAFAESSAEILRGLGINSGAWSLSSGGFGLDSESLASDRTAQFFHGLETDLANLSSMFSLAAAGLDIEFGGSDFSSSSGSLSS